MEDNPDSIGISLLQLVILPEQTAVTQARELVTRAKQQIEQGSRGVIRVFQSG